MIAGKISIKNILLSKLLIMLFALPAHALVQPPEFALKHMVCFTTESSVKLELLFEELPAQATNYVINIVDDKTGKTVFKQAVKPTLIDKAENKIIFNVAGLKVHAWMPANPALYQLTFTATTAAKKKIEEKKRIGFRFFESKNGHLFLNGKPIFLRGIAINPPGRGVPPEIENSRAFALEYVAYMKSINVNIIRIPDAEDWYNVCDELGMMTFGGNYSAKVAGGEKVEAQEKLGDETDAGFPSDDDRGVNWYKNEKFSLIASHPSLMVYAMTNETPFAGKRAELWEKFLSYAFEKLKQWDNTRVYIANAGYGYGKTGDITDLHRYWGWYYSSPFTFLNIRDEAKINPFPSKNQPITFTECVGNYTGPDGRYNLTPSHKNPSSQLSWTGHAAQDLQAQLADDHQAFTFRQATETFRQLRSINPKLSGVFPFTILFYNWNTITQFSDMNPKPVTDQVKISYQPVLLSWECWTPNVNAGTSFTAIAHIINDANDFSDLVNAKLLYQIKDKTDAVVFKDSIQLADIPYYGTGRKELSIALPSSMVTGDYKLSGQVIQGGKMVSQNFYELFVADKNFAVPALAPASILLYDKNGATEKSFLSTGIKFTKLSSFENIAPNSCIVIGENAADKNVGSSFAAIKKYMADGGRVLCLRQDSVHFENVNPLLLSPVANHNIDIDDPVYPVSPLSPRNGYYINPERPDHPIFNGIGRENLRVWNDYTNWDETKKGLPAITPVTDGFTFKSGEDVANTAILGNYSYGLQAIALAEQFQQQGSILLCGLDIARRTTIDPVAKKMLLNLVNYTSTHEGHQKYPLITSRIVWGDYETEKGVVTDWYSGFLVNSTPRVPADYLGKGIVITPEGYQLAGGEKAGFNTRPGIQYVANGRRPFGPYIAGVGRQPIPEKAKEGIAKFWCTIPTGENNSTSVVWNPGKEPLRITIKVNDLPEVSKTINAGEKRTVEAPVDKTNVSMTYTGDRRLVILETSFSTKKDD